MGIYLRGKTWWISYFVEGRQRFESSRSAKKRDAQRLLDIRKGAVRERRLRLTRSNAPRFEEYTRNFLLTIQNPNTRKRYTSSVRNLIASFGNAKLSDITADRIEDFKEKRLSQGLRTATINRDLAVLRRMMKLAQRKLFVTENPFGDVDFCEGGSNVVAHTFSTLKKKSGYLPLRILTYALWLFSFWKRVCGLGERHCRYAGTTSTSFAT